ncbi:transporter [Trypanosoma rangeli]|uniref:Transporter n=1 Tax=Trypanosoma rangeli TaxID=5698 RepID=A0A422N5B5_TRYRA|nr:transporter [Trypanosoma rangeli]RNF00655.1 transporter [Trypanosoma rangeli]|eukprot:RNF00655.1 transporter [Trypanosoma rangeli]
MASFWDLVREWARPLHIPNILQSSTNGVRSALVPVFARRLGLTDSQVGFIIGSAGIVKVLLDVAFGFAASLHGTRVIMIAGMLLNVLGSIVAMFAFYSALLTASMLWGAGVGCFFVARQFFVARAVPRSIRGRLMSLVGGFTRWCVVLGPAIAGLMIDFVSVRLAAFSIAPISLTCAYIVATNEKIRAVDEEISEGREDHNISKELSLMVVALQKYWDIIIRIGVYSFNLVCLRQGRSMLLALAAINMGLSASMVGLVLGSSYVVDATLFFLGGYIVDKFGEIYTTIPTSVNLGVAFLVLAHANTLATLLLSAVLFGVADSTGCGILMILTAEHSPPSGGASFMGLMGTVQDLGQVVGPMVSGLIMEYFGFASVCYVLGGVGALNALWAYFMIPAKSCTRVEEEEAASKIIDPVAPAGDATMVVVEAEEREAVPDAEDEGAIHLLVDEELEVSDAEAGNEVKKIEVQEKG